MIWKVRLPMACSWKYSSLVTGTAISSEVSLSIAIVSLPVGGMITRIACGSTIRRIVAPRLMPERAGRLGLTGVDRLDAGADDLGHVGALGQRQPDQPGGEAAEDLVAVQAEEVQVAAQPEQRCISWPPNGTPRV